MGVSSEAPIISCFSSLREGTNCGYNVAPVTILLRFIFGFILAGGLMLWLQMSFPANLIVAVSLAIIAAIWGDKFILGFMSLMRYFR
jgi:hypothetical protein